MGRTAENGLKSNPEAVTRGERTELSTRARWLFDEALALTRAEKSRIQPLVRVSLCVQERVCVSLSVCACACRVSLVKITGAAADEKSREDEYKGGAVTKFAPS